MRIHNENEADAPLVISEAYVEAGHAYQTTVKGVRGDGEQLVLIDKGESARRVRFTIKMANHSNRTITQFHAKILNPALIPDESIMISSVTLVMASRGQVIRIAPQESFTFVTDLPLAESSKRRHLMDHLSEFRIKIAEAAFEHGASQEQAAINTARTVAWSSHRNSHQNSVMPPAGEEHLAWDRARPERLSVCPQQG